MSKYEVIVPFCGSQLLVVEAENQEEAIEVAMDSISLKEGLEDDTVMYEYYRKIVGGNVFYGEVNEVSADLVKDEE